MPHLKLLHGAWVFVGDGQKALFLINEGDEKFPNLRRLAVLENPDPPTHEQGSDAPGRAYASLGQMRSSVGETDWHELQKERFAVSIAEQINKAAMSNAFSQIVIVARQKFLAACGVSLRKKQRAKSSPRSVRISPVTPSRKSSVY